MVQAPEGFREADEKEAKARQEAHDLMKADVKGNEAFLKVKEPTQAESDEQITKLTGQMIRVEKLLLNDIQEA